MLNNVKKTFIYGAISIALLSALLAQAETVPGTDFNLHFESSNIVGSGRSITIHRVPVVILEKSVEFKPTD